MSIQTLIPEIIVKAACDPSSSQDCSNLSQQDFDAIVNNWPNWVPCAGGSSSSSSSTGGISSGSVYILGDSITDRAGSTYQTNFQQKGITAVIDASDSRSLSAPGINGNKLSGMQAIAADASKIQQAGAIVIALGTNGGNTNSSIDQAIASIRADNSSAPIYWVDTMVVNRPSYDSTIQQANQAIYSQATGDDYSVISWAQTVDPGINPQNITGNMADPNGYIDPNPASGLGVHPSIPAGVNALVNLVVGKVSSGGTSSSTSSGSCCGNSGGSAAIATAAITGDNVKDSYNFFVSNGFSPAQASGIVGNLLVESGDNPTEVEKGGGGGYGIAQFTGSQRTEMVNWTTANGLDPNSLQGQLEYLLYVITQGDESDVAPAVKATNDPASAADAFEKTYERAGVPALQQRENDAQQVFNQYGGGGGSGPSTASCSSSSPSTGSTGCQNPFRDIKNLRPERVDQGVDYGGSGNVYAVCTGTITHISGDGGWNYGGPPWPDAYIVIQISGGKYNGLLSYMAEECTPQVQIGQQVTTSTVICTMDNASSSGIETGWAASPTDSQPLAQLYKGNGCCSTTAGVSYNNLLKSLGTPSGNINTSVIGSPLPSNYP